MPARDPLERRELSRVGAYARWRNTPDNPGKEKAARARLAALQARRRLIEAATIAAAAERELADLGVVDE